MPHTEGLILPPLYKEFTQKNVVKVMVTVYGCATNILKNVTTV